MCQLLGMNCNSDAAITFSFTGFAARGGRTAAHVDGWGMAFYERSGCRVFHDDQPASESPLAEFLSRYPIKSRIVIAHLRRATQGDVTIANCHPFQREWLGQTWLFANNGDLTSFHPTLNGPYRPVGSTDSERAFCWLLQELRHRFADRQQPPAWHELAPHVAQLSEVIARHGNFNFLLTNGEALYTHCSSRLQVLQRRHPFPMARLVDCDMSLDLSAMNGQNDRLVIVATDPLTTDEAWQPLATGECRVFVDGEEVWRQVNPATRAFPIVDATIGRPWSGLRQRASTAWPLLLRDIAR
ncbi:class II glutamine amidotransferase [Roseateles amylovorans]|uniref:Class II glutamine amidotransferase n=1 Tax=Roseateles amylovorans TaxID=2978473 RepID=A0ABY6AZQ3_9BURK|nr:class II glutamine amidotransferase [Roseateles amylovorans]UXH78646.1 class II glutamine amidotransferase [Roseateles amylovorans]